MATAESKEGPTLPFKATVAAAGTYADVPVPAKPDNAEPPPGPINTANPVNAEPLFPNKPRADNVYRTNQYIDALENKVAKLESKQFTAIKRASAAKAELKKMQA